MNYNFDSKLHDIIIDGIPVSDYGDDIKIKIAYDEDFRSLTTGVDGATTINEHHNRNAKITVNILQSSPLNAVLTELARNKRTFTIAHVDRNFNGDVGAFSTKAYFIKTPDLEIGKEAKSREWVIQAIRLKSTFSLLD